MILSKKLVLWLKKRGKTLAVAESCTGGLFSHEITNVPGSSDVFIGSVVAYSNRVKEKTLQIPKKLLKKHGAVSAEVAVQMAKNVRKVFRADIGLGITGIAGPSGGSKKKPVGLVYTAVSDGRRTRTREDFFRGNRLEIKRQAAQAALDLLGSRLKKYK